MTLSLSNRIRVKALKKYGLLLWDGVYFLTLNASGDKILIS